MFQTCCGCSEEDEHARHGNQGDAGILQKESSKSSAMPDNRPAGVEAELLKSEDEISTQKALGDAGCTVLNNVELEFDKMQELSDITESHRLCAMNTVDCNDLFAELGLPQSKQRMCRFDPSVESAE